MMNFRSAYIPALLTGIESPIKQVKLYNNHDASWFTDLAYFYHPHMLVSYYYSGKIFEYRKMLRILDDIELWADSGGYSLATQGGEIDVRKVLKWQEHNANVAFSLDLPPSSTENTTRISPGKHSYHTLEKFERNAEISRQNNLDFMTLRTSDKLKIYNVIHGYSNETIDLWWDYATKDVQFEGYATGLKPSSDALLQAMCIMKLYDKGVRKNLHLLGVAGITVIPLIVWCSQYIDRISFDSTSYGYGSRTRAYVYPDRIRDYTHFGKKYLTKKNPMKKLYCECPICQDVKTVDYFCESNVTWPGLLISLHNLWCFQNYTNLLNQTLHAEKNKEKFIALIKTHTGDWADKTLYAINFVEDCMKYGYDKAYSMYFQEHDSSKQKFARQKLI